MLKNVEEISPNLEKSLKSPNSSPTDRTRNLGISMNVMRAGRVKEMESLHGDRFSFACPVQYYPLSYVDAKWLVRRYSVVRGQTSLNERVGDGNGVRHNVGLVQYDVRRASRSRPRHGSLDRHKNVEHFQGHKHGRIHVFTIGLGASMRQNVTSVMGTACKTASEESKTIHAARYDGSRKNTACQIRYLEGTLGDSSEA